MAKPLSKKSSRPKASVKKQVLIFGASGRMGEEVIKILKNHPTLKLAATVNSKEILAIDEAHTAVLKNTKQALTAVLQGADVVIDFSTPKATLMLSQCLGQADGKIVLIGTTGLSDANILGLKKIAKKSNHKILVTGNTSLGVMSLAKLAAMAAKDLAPAGFDVEISETHHRLKIDAPSGTALLLAGALKRAIPGSKIDFNRTGKRLPHSIGISSVRGGGVIGEHSIRFISDNEEIQLSHRAFDRSLFASGAVNLIDAIDRKFHQGEGKDLLEFILD